jgi:hypothetical protein
MDGEKTSDYWVTMVSLYCPWKNDQNKDHKYTKALFHFKYNSYHCPKPKARRRVDTKKGDYMCVLDNFKNYEIYKTTFK